MIFTYNDLELAEAEEKVKELAYKCKICAKSFNTKATYDQHMNSVKHRETLKSNENKNAIILSGQVEEKITSKVRSTTIEDQTICLFCNKKSNIINE